MNRMLILLLMVSCSSIIGSYAGIINEVVVLKYLILKNEEEDIEYGNNGNRLPQYSVPCAIDPTAGVHLIGEGQVDILYYEIWNINGGCISSFDSEEDFLEILFKLSGEYEIRLITENCTYIGIIST